MGLETDSLVASLAELFSMIRIRCNGCAKEFYTAARDDSETSASIKGKCPRCGGKDLALADTDQGA